MSEFIHVNYDDFNSIQKLEDNKNIVAVMTVSYTHLPSPRDGLLSRMPSSA